MKRECVTVMIAGKMRRRVRITCDCGRSVIADGDVWCSCGQRYNRFGNRLRRDAEMIDPPRNPYPA